MPDEKFISWCDRSGHNCISQNQQTNMCFQEQQWISIRRNGNGADKRTGVGRLRTLSEILFAKRVMGGLRVTQVLEIFREYLLEFVYCYLSSFYRKLNSYLFVHQVNIQKSAVRCRFLLTVQNLPGKLSVRQIDFWYSCSVILK